MMEKWLAHVSDLELWKRYKEINRMIDNHEVPDEQLELLWSEWDIIAAELDRRYPVQDEENDDSTLSN